MGRPFRLDELQFYIDGHTLAQIQVLVSAGIATLNKDFKRPPKTVQGFALQSLPTLGVSQVFYNTFWEQVVEEIDDIYRSVGEDYPNVWDEILYVLECRAKTATLEPIQSNLRKITMPCAIREIIDDMETVNFKYIENDIKNCTNKITLYSANQTARKDEEIVLMVDALWFRLKELSEQIKGTHHVVYGILFDLPVRITGKTPCIKFSYNIRPGGSFSFHDNDDENLYTKSIIGLYDVLFQTSTGPLFYNGLTFKETVDLINSH